MESSVKRSSPTEASLAASQDLDQKPVEEILPEIPSLYSLFQLTIGGCNHPDIDFNLLMAPNPIELPLCQNP